MNKILFLSFVFAATSCGKSQTPLSAPQAVSEKVVRDPNGNIIYVDTHDQYAHTGVVNRSLFTYFQRKNSVKAVALTFDCAWVESANGLEILDALKRNNIKSTFFISGPFIFADYKKGLAGGLNYTNKELIRRIILDGHEVGNHTQTHPHLADNPNWDAELNGLKRGWNAYVQAIFGATPPPNATLKTYWRSPYGEYNDASLRAASQAGYPFHFGWNVDVADSTGKADCRQGSSSNCWDAGKMTDRVLNFAELNTYSLDAFVVLAHLSNPYHWGYYNDGIDKIATTFRAKSYTFARLTEVFKYAKTEPLGKLACPAGYTLTPIGTKGGQYCTDGVNVVGPFTESMIQKCVSWGGGNACSSNRWEKSLFLNARDSGLCPAGAEYDATSTYCTEKENAFGPFPSSLVSQCLAEGGGDPCYSARWNREFLVSLLYGVGSDGGSAKAKVLPSSSVHL